MTVTRNVNILSTPLILYKFIYIQSLFYALLLKRPLSIYFTS